MISLRKRQLVIALILACICPIALSQEPNWPVPELKFEIGTEEKPWVRDRKNCPGRGPVKPTHAAEFLLSQHDYSFHLDLEGTDGIRDFLKTKAARSLSRAQRDFLVQSDASVWTDHGNIVRRYSQLRLYAVSEDDARTMVRSVIEQMTGTAKERMRQEKNLADEYEEKIAKIRWELPQKQVKLEAASVSYREFKKATHQLSSDSDATEEAKETILEMNKVLDALTIEIAGIEAKLSAIDRYKSKKDVSIQGLAKLEQILSEQNIELAGALARRKAVLRIRSREEEFLNRYQQWHELAIEVSDSKENLPKFERKLRNYEEWLADLTPERLPPKVFQNKVTIYPVRVEE